MIKMTTVKQGVARKFYAEYGAVNEKSLWTTDKRFHQWLIFVY